MERKTESLEAIVNQFNLSGIYFYSNWSNA